MVAAACGGGETPSTEGEVDPEGIVSVEGLLTETTGPQFYPSTSSLTGDNAWMRAIYGSLLSVQPDGSIEPFLAEAYEVVDSTSISLKLREGMKFSNGEDFNAEAVATGLMANLTPENPAVAASRTLDFRKLSDVEVVNDYEVLIKLSAPVAGQFVKSLADPRQSAIVAPSARDTDDTYPEVSPVGAGPFMLEEFVPKQYILVKKNPNFYDAQNWKLGGIRWVQTLAGPTQTTGLLSGALDFTKIPANDLSAVQSNSTFTTRSVVSLQDYAALNMCATKAPFDDPRVRRAVSLAINRDQLNQLWQGGLGAPQRGYFLPDSPNAYAGLEDLVTYDPEEAKRLLQEANATDLTIPFYFTTGYVTASTVEVIQAQLAEVGIKLTVTDSPDTVNEFIVPQKPGMMMIRSVRLPENQIAATMGGGLITLCGAQHPDITDLLAKAQALDPADPQAIAAYQEIEKIVGEETWMVFLVTMPSHWTWNTEKIGGTPTFSPWDGSINFQSIYVKKS
jgi:ABC-type transport system substrate-binding protein